MQTFRLAVCILTAAPAFATTISTVPEPSSLSMLAVGGAAGLFLLWRKKRNAK
ncbi:MAG: PEP-CTERM sorting domain-containing protein [Acidobacteria bacterium]|nr:PEP-CTERM sorting domain-containing protein [Acidobacteriota bacterium]